MYAERTEIVDETKLSPEMICYSIIQISILCYIAFLQYSVHKHENRAVKRNATQV